MSDLILFWHRRDLRMTDNIGLAKAREQSSKVVGVFCLDPLILQRDDVASVRVHYMVGSLNALQEQYAKLGGQLLILKADPTIGLPKLAIALQANALFFNHDVEPYAQQRDRTVTDELESVGVRVHSFWDQLLHPPDEIKAGTGQPYTVYTPFWRNWSSQTKLSPAPDLQQLTPLTEVEHAQASAAGVIPLPTAKALGFSWDRELVLNPGTQAAQDRLDEFCDRAIASYQEQRNFPSVQGTSQLSAALKFGVIGIRTVWAATVTASQYCQSDEARDGIRTWQQELAWREFYQHAMYHFPALATGPYRPLLQNFPWENNEEHFQAWCEGRTGYPIVDAAMRQMNETGWMHNRCRMIVASFLTKDLLVNGQLGETYFMQKLIDGDLSANNGGWQWSTSSGMDPKPLRIFNPMTQAQKFDPEGDYIRQWLPELRAIETESILTGKVLPLERQHCGYPEPIIDHNQQQRLFKHRYQQQKGIAEG
jgi:deoxyribodipyrimidine photo-lyase